MTKLLNNREEQRYWTNSVLTLGAIGDESAIDPLMSFFQQGEGELSRSAYTAKVSVPIAMGYIAARQKSERALKILLAGVEPSSWKVNWVAAHVKDPKARDQDLSQNVVIGLGLSGLPEAKAELIKLAGMARTKDFVITATPEATVDLVDNALKTHDSVSRYGLTEYFKTQFK